MIKDKYQIMMCDRINATIQSWEQQPTIQEHDLYTFLHNLKGTAGSIGMEDLSEISGQKLDLLEENSKKTWTKEDWKGLTVQIEEVVSFFDTNLQCSNADINETRYINEQFNKNFILVIDDDMVFVSFIKNILESKGFIVIVAHNGQRGLELIYELNPALVFLDIKLPDINGFSILENINKVSSNHMFVTIMSVDDSKENRIKAYDLGAMDFIKKPLDGNILAAYVRNRLSFKQALELSIVTDELTQVFNRKYMNYQLSMLTEQYEKDRKAFSVAIADIDFFKKVNDTYGHIKGDEVLRGFAKTVMAVKRNEDIFCRYGGEEFVLIMPNTTKEAAYRVVERMRKLVSEQHYIGNENVFEITSSFGITEIDESNKHPKILMEQADRALYKAKVSGRNQSVVFTEEETYSIIQKVTLIVIDDVSIIRKFITNHFAEIKLPEDYILEIITFEDGVKFLNSNWYDKNTKYIILLDGIMPHMDGLEVLKEIRKKHSSNDVIVSMLTGRNDEEYVLEAFANGADDFIVKPFNIAEVSNRILQLANQLFVKVRQ
ncbi:diguanylate cyclase [Solibacillus sp. A46]|uniref:Diguanylate cyclase n=1 Tax=Solibacillus faecavium TaxID=2762221 RepID=A0ABR8XW65_9BACL|nr:diguanylate cyclase [Solibacillus faecavium]MBD8036179.1 diguanylate cyclase [Solibacillus faecavium]